jgi:hypothetical protein
MEGEDKLEESAERISEFMENVPEDLVEIAQECIMKREQKIRALTESFG